MKSPLSGEIPELPLQMIGKLHIIAAVKGRIMGKQVYLTDVERKYLVVELRLWKRTFNLWSRCHENSPPFKDRAKARLAVVNGLLRKLRP